MIDALATLALGNLGAAVPWAIRTNDPAEFALYKVTANRVLKIKADAAKG